MQKTVKNETPGKSEAEFMRAFDGVRYLFGDEAFIFFRQAHVCIVGLGGVGSWAVEAMARHAIGRITLVDFDRVALTNLNRQIQALVTTQGEAKPTVLKSRIAQINPFCEVQVFESRLTIENVPEFFEGQQFDYVIDAIDDVFAKTALIAWCRENAVPLVTVGGAGGQSDPTRVEVCDLCRTEQEPLLARVRKRLRQKYGFPRGNRPFAIDAVYSTEPLKYPESASAEFNSTNGKEEGASIQPLRFGTSVAVTATFGMTAASVVLRRLAERARFAA